MDDALRKAFRERLIRFMHDRRLTIRQVAEQTGMAPSTLQTLRSGGLTTNYLALKKMAELFGISLEDLLLGSDGGTAHSPKPRAATRRAGSSAASGSAPSPP